MCYPTTIKRNKTLTLKQTTMKTALYIVTFRISEWGDLIKQAEVGAFNSVQAEMMLRKYMRSNRRSFDLPAQFDTIITDSIRVGYVGTEGVLKIKTV